MFDKTAIKQCFALHSINNNESIQDIYTNLYEAVLSASIACAATGEYVGGLKLTERGKEKLREIGQDWNLASDIYLGKVFEQSSETNLFSKSLKSYIVSTCLQYGTDLKRMILQLADYYE